jgi:hypothetical protein
MHMTGGNLPRHRATRTSVAAELLGSSCGSTIDRVRPVVLAAVTAILANAHPAVCTTFRCGTSGPTVARSTYVVGAQAKAVASVAA